MRSWIPKGAGCTQWDISDIETLRWVCENGYGAREFCLILRKMCVVFFVRFSDMKVVTWCIDIFFTSIAFIFTNLIF